MKTKRVRIRLTEEAYERHYAPVGIERLFVHPGFECSRNVEVTREWTEAEVTAGVARELPTRELGGVRLFEVEEFKGAKAARRKKRAAA